jgi:hypothetical protein
VSVYNGIGRTRHEAEMQAHDRRIELEDRALEIFKLVVAEWKSDPMSVQCFDLRVVREGIAAHDELVQIDTKFPNRLF